jgi:hypothetical protein
MRLRDWLDNPSANTTPERTLAGDLPGGCPLLGGKVPPECRFEPRFFKRMANEGVLPLPDGSCPLRRVCKLERGK